MAGVLSYVLMSLYLKGGLQVWVFMGKDQEN